MSKSTPELFPLDVSFADINDEKLDFFFSNIIDDVVKMVDGLPVRFALHIKPDYGIISIILVHPEGMYESPLGDFFFRRNGYTLRHFLSALRDASFTPAGELIKLENPELNYSLTEWRRECALFFKDHTGCLTVDTRECVVCYEYTWVGLLRCGHRVCNRCIIRIETLCPICREPFHEAH